MDGRRGQVSIYLIIVLIMGLSLIFFINGNSDFISQEYYPPEIAPLKQYIESCLQLVATEGIFQIARQGGYYKQSRYMLQIFNETVPYYFIEERVIIPDLATIENELSLYITDNFEGCIHRYEDKNFLITRRGRQRSIESSINKNSIEVHALYPIDAVQQNQKTILSQFDAEITNNISEMIELARLFIDEYKEKPGYICLTCISRLSEKNGYFLHFSTLNNESFIGSSENIMDSLLVSITDENDKHNNVSFKLSFLVDQRQTSIPELPYKITTEEANATIGYKFNYKINKKYVKFYDDSSLFKINEISGDITFTPTQKDIGSYVIKISMIDNLGKEQIHYLLLNVKGFNQNPVIEEIPFQIAYLQNTFYYAINATDRDNDTIFYIDNTDFFNISESSGIINFTPINIKTGVYRINITAYDEKGGFDTNQMRLWIRE